MTAHGQQFMRQNDERGTVTLISRKPTTMRSDFHPNDEDGT